MMHAAVAAIQFSLEAEDGQSFLRLWNEGEFDVCRREWPEAPKEVYIGADPMLPETRALLGAVSYQQGRMRFFIEQVMRGEQPDTRRAAAQILDELYPNNEQKAAPAQGLCEDEGCPHHGVPHVCVDARERDAAVATLKALGYTYHGGEQWKPPLGTRYHDTDRLNLLTDCIEGNWSIRFRIKPGKAPQWQMIDDGDPWGKWHNCPRKAIDEALAAVKGVQLIAKDYEDAKAAQAKKGKV
ncbi:hypothetical protein [Herbaspirillum huttiense]|uniref:Uncharacterized protein n=1 Tax=Herbaspirillum huttiense subsp. lycopersici TaxID=3074428 RepID=A0ABU2EG12_9BURK|nr:hypothetical protein [Herbaspirillum huttiense]MDR9847080.1 hypothetical protein [Herbaspirillum huttiense SE1]